MEVIVVGAGAIGSLYGAKLAAQNDVTLIGRPEHVRAINADGLRVEGLEHGERASGSVRGDLGSAPAGGHHAPGAGRAGARRLRTGGRPGPGCGWC